MIILTFGKQFCFIAHEQGSKVMYQKYHKATSSNTSRLEALFQIAHEGDFRSLFLYVLWDVTHINTGNSTVP